MTARRMHLSYAARMPERELQQLVADLCQVLGLPHFHPLNSRGMRAGWPDSVIIGSRVIYRELKSQDGKLSPDQRAIGDKLLAAGADWAIWRPGDWLRGGIEKELRNLAARQQSLLDALDGALDGGVQDGAGSIGDGPWHD